MTASIVTHKKISIDSGYAAFLKIGLTVVCIFYDRGSGSFFTGKPALNAGHAAITPDRKKYPDSPPTLRSHSIFFFPFFYFTQLLLVQIPFPEAAYRIE
jgi:hypothetical protein